MSLLSRRYAVLMFFVITGVPIALLTYFSIAISTESAIHQAEVAAGDSAQASAVFIRQRLLDVAEQLDAFTRAELSTAMADGTPPRVDRTALQEDLTHLIQARSGFNFAFVTDTRGLLLAIAPRRPDLMGRYFTGEDWYQGISARDGPYVAGLSATAAQQDLNSVVIAAPIWEASTAPDTTRRVGYLVGAYGLDKIQSFVDDVARTRGTRLSIVDSQGFLLAAPGLQPGSVISFSDSDRLLDQALAGRAAVSEVTEGGRRTLAAYAPVPGLGWVVVAGVPEDAALQYAETLRSTVLAIAGVLGLVLTAGVVVGQALVHRAQQTETLRQRMQTLFHLDEAARSVYDERGPRALQIIAASARRLVGADCSLLAIRDGSGRLASAAHDASPELAAADVSRLADQVCGWAERWRPGDAPVRAGAASRQAADEAASPLDQLMSAPLSAGERALGWLVVARRPGEPAFDAIAELRLQQMARHATSVLEKERHDAEREAFLDRVSRTNRELERASRLKSQFLATMSHELRTPLSAIIGFSELLLEGASGELSAEQEADVREISRAGRMLLEVVSDILDLSKIEAGRMRLDRHVVRLGPLLADVAATLRPLAQEKALYLDVDAAPDAPAVAVDPLRIRQVVNNLLSNAIKFTQRGGVVIGLRPVEGEVEVSVTDTGIGIAREALPLVFDEFSQVDSSARREHGGTGLGLSIAQKLIQLHGGTIGVESRPGVGSRFWFRLPAGEGAGAAAPAAGPPR